MSWLNHLTKFSNESYRHFVAKSILFYLLREIKHDVATEWRVPNGYIDICDKTTHTLYEIELYMSPKYRSRKFEQYDISGYDVIIVDCLKMPDDIDGICKFLSDFVLPD
jgi:hypothetical protein